MEPVETLALIVGIIGTAIAIYQWAVINESKKRKSEIQYLLAGISHLALSKQQAWINQIVLLKKPEDEEQLAHLRSCVRARDDLTEVYSIVTALEGAIDPDSSAATSLLEKSLKQSKINNELQKTALENPSLSVGQDGE